MTMNGRYLLDTNIIIALFAVLIEMVTLFFRFGLGLKATEHTASSIGRLTGGVRIHHGYVGLLLLLLGRKCRRSKQDLLMVAGAALFISDLVHHALLYLLTGSADLDLVYQEMRQ